MLGFYVPPTAKVIRRRDLSRFKVSSERLFLHLIRSKSIELRKRIFFEKSAEIVLYILSQTYIHSIKSLEFIVKRSSKNKTKLNLGQRFACHGGCPLSGRYCHPTFLWLSSLHARMKKIRSKCCCFFQSVNIIIVFIKNSRVANSAARDGIGPKFELIETSMDVLVTCQNEEDPIKMLLFFSECKHYYSFQTLKGS